MTDRLLNITLLPLSSAPAWLEGMQGAARQVSPWGNSELIVVTVGLFVVLALNFRDCRKLLGRFADELRTGRRRRANAFDERGANGRRLTALLMVQYVVYGGVLLCGAGVWLGGRPWTDIDDPLTVAAGVGAMGVYCIVQLGIYAAAGWAFGGAEKRDRWLRAFTASQSLAGIAMIVPALLMLFHPGVLTAALAAGLAVYCITRVVFIIKGFIIFYHNLFSAVYFILYLCALEIIPVIYMSKVALLL